MPRRITDKLGNLDVPEDALYGPQTARAISNFPISGICLKDYPEFVRSLAMVKKACALANAELGQLGQDKADIIVEVCDEILDGQHLEHFAVDMIQGGAGTSSNMNANEVIANIGLLKMGHAVGATQFLHPNDDVNRSQSTNDVYPTAMRLAILMQNDQLLSEYRLLKGAFDVKAAEFCDIRKVGRTQLQDAVPMTLGQEFAAFAATLDDNIERVSQLTELLYDINLGGTAIGTGINTVDGYAELAVRNLAQISNYAVRPARNLVGATYDLGSLVLFSGGLKSVAVKLSKIASDLRLLSSGPRAGIGEIVLPPMQAGSSIMPGKVNPVIPEVVNQVCYLVVGNDLTVTMAADAGELQLNAMEPVLAYRILESIALLQHAMRVLRKKCIVGIVADEQRCAAHLERSLIMVTALAPLIGYDHAAELADRARTEGLSLRDAAQRYSGLDPQVLDAAL